MAILISDKRLLSQISRDKERHILIKVSIHQEDITFINIYLSNDIALKYMTQKLTELKGEIQF